MRPFLRKLSFMQKIVLSCSLLLYILSFCFTAYTTSYHNELQSTPGGAAFFMGGLAIVGGGLFEFVFWLANPLYLLSIIFMKSKKSRARVLSALAMVLAFSFLFTNTVLGDEGGGLASIESLHRILFLAYKYFILDIFPMLKRK